VLRNYSRKQQATIF